MNNVIAMFRSVLLEKDLWIEHLKLDPVTGLDPPGIKIRAAQGQLHWLYFTEKKLMRFFS